MNILFISGSANAELSLEALSKLNECIINNIPTFDFDSDHIIVGDCHGIDLAIQGLSPNTTVFHVGRVRNNPYDHETYEVPNQGKSGREYYTQKDIQMSLECTHHIGLAKGISKGTRANHLRVSNDFGKPSFLIEL